MNAITWSSKNSLPVEVRATAVGLLNQQLADVLDLGLQARQAHWNVKGPNFIALHELFGELGEALDGFADDLAERAVALGGTACGTLQAIAPATRLAPYPINMHAGHEHVAALSASLARTGQSMRSAVTTADEAGDVDTADLLTGISRELDQLLWKVEAHAWKNP
jgi:starvation-inducible DNA-binding protein